MCKNSAQKWWYQYQCQSFILRIRTLILVRGHKLRSAIALVRISLSLFNRRSTFAISLLCMLFLILRALSIGYWLRNIVCAFRLGNNLRIIKGLLIVTSLKFRLIIILSSPGHLLFYRNKHSFTLSRDQACYNFLCNIFCRVIQKFL